jgi:muramoyltetrapeptide carboxypeptidase
LTYEKKVVILRMMKHIRIISPSGVIASELILQAKECLQAWGYRVSVGQFAMEQYGRFAGTVEQRLADLNMALADSTVDIILCSRGGYGLQQILDQIQLPLRPKETWPLIVGYSDITELHNLMALHGVKSLHAGMCKEVANFYTESLPAIHLENNSYNRIGTSTGAVIGGNLSVLYGLQGTKWDLHHIIDNMDAAPILLIEDISESHYHIDRMMNNLRMSGVLARVSGLVVGHFTDCNADERMMCNIEQTILQAVSGYDYPILFGAPIGHELPNLPVMLGEEYHLCVESKNASLIPINKTIF